MTNVVPIESAQRQQERPTTSPVHDLDAEMAIVAAILLDARILETVRRVLAPEHMYAAQQRRILEAMYGVADAGDPVDIVTVSRWLQARERLAEVGGIAYLGRLVDDVPAVANVETYARIVFELWQIRELGTRCSTIAAHCRTGAYHGEPREVLDRAKRAIGEISDMTPRGGGATTIGAVLRQRAEEAIRASAEGRAGLGISTGFQDLDDATSGLMPGAVWIIAARPGCGKTALASCIAINVAGQGHGVLLVSGEQKKAQLATRMIASEACVDVSRIERGAFTEEEQAAMVQAQVWLSTLPIHIDTNEPPLDPVTGLPKKTAAPTQMLISDVRHTARMVHSERAKTSQPLRLVIVDYLQLFAVSEEPHDIAEVSRGLKQIATELGVTVIAPTQMNRSVEERGGLPKMRDLKGSSRIEADADLIGFVVGEERVKQIYFAKARSQKKGSLVPLTFTDKYTRFDAYDPSRDGPIPAIQPESSGGGQRSSRPGRYEKRRDP